MVQHVFGKPGLAVSSVHVTLYDLKIITADDVTDDVNVTFYTLKKSSFAYQFSTGQTWWFITAMAYLRTEQRTIVYGANLKLKCEQKKIF